MGVVEEFWFSRATSCGRSGTYNASAEPHDWIGQAVSNTKAKRLFLMNSKRSESEATAKAVTHFETHDVRARKLAVYQQARILK